MCEDRVASDKEKHVKLGCRAESLLVGSVSISMFDIRCVRTIQNQGAGPRFCLWAQFADRCLINWVDHGDDDDDDDDDDNDDA